MKLLKRTKKISNFSGPKFATVAFSSALAKAYLCIACRRMTVTVVAAVITSSSLSGWSVIEIVATSSASGTTAIIIASSIIAAVSIAAVMVITSMRIVATVVIVAVGEIMEEPHEADGVTPTAQGR